MVEVYQHTIVKKFAGDFPPPRTFPGTLLAGENLVALTVLESDVDGKVLKHTGFSTDANTPPVDTTGKVVGVLVDAVDATAADANCTYYNSGCFFDSELIWPASATTELLKRKLLEGSMITVVFQQAGEV